MTTDKVKASTVKLAADDNVFVNRLEMLSPVEQMEIIEQIAELMPIDVFPPVRLRRAGEVKEFDIEDWKKRTGYQIK
jgi:hypothetical protein